MLRILRGGQRWLTAAIVIGVGTVFVVFLGLQGPVDFASPSRLVVVGPFEFGVQEFERVRARRQEAIQGEVGDQVDERSMRELLDDLAARELIEQALLALAAGDMGLQVTTREIERLVLSDPGFRNEQGRFDRERFEDYTDYVYGSQKAFMEERRLALLSIKMLSLLNDQPEVSDGEARDVLRRELEEVQIAFAAIGADAAEPPEIAADAIAAALTTRADEIAQRYQEMGETYNRPERVRARHILRTVARDAPAADVDRARGEIEAAAARIEKGEPFEAVAEDLSQDPGSQQRGGDLGFFARGQMVREFEDAAFALAPGQISGPVRTDFGFHLIEALERQEALSRPLDEVREEIAADLLRREALRERARARAEDLAAAVRGGQSLEAAAREREIAVRRSGSVTRRGDGFVAGLGASPELVAEAFVLEVGQSSRRIFEIGDQFALIQLVERRAADPAQVDALLDAKREELLQAKRNARTAAWIDARRDALLASGDLVVNLASIQQR